MTAARDRTRSTVAAMRASRRAAPIGAAGGMLVAGMLALGNPFAVRPPGAPQPEIRESAVGLSLPEPTTARAVPTSWPPAAAPAPAAQASGPVFVVPPAMAAPEPVPAAAPPTPALPAKRIGGGKRATIIVETLPAKPIIPPFIPKPPAGATPEPHPPLPLDTETEAKGATLPPVLKPPPAPKTAAVSMPRDG